MTVSRLASREQSFAERLKMAGPRCSSKVRLIAFIALFVALFATGSATAQVPLLIWTSESLPPLASPAAGHITSNDQLNAYLTSAFSSGSHTVLLFLQDKLSKDDFTVFGGVFGNKQDSAFQNLEAVLQSSSSSVTLPALEWSGSSAVLPLLKDKLGVSPLPVDADTLSELTINASVNNLLLISLPYCTGLQKSCKEVLHINDEIIGKVLSIVKAKNVLYTAVYTGVQPSRVISETSVPNQPVGRSLLQAVVADVSPPIMFNVSGSPCIMLWAQNLNISFTSTSPWLDLATQTPSLAGSLCNQTNSLTVLMLISSFAMSQRFYPGSARNWFTLDSVQLQSSGQTASFIGSRSIYAPAEYSFHCQSVNSFDQALLVPNNTNQNTSQWRLNFINFQIQGFGLGNGTNFSYASDCAGFFSPGIWMGLVTSLVMLLILVYGLHMIMQLSTMDRFDDPKGPSISVPQSE
uniref:ATPase H+ transporting accessory protein 1b n=1 Tax=Mastacembelus armatus TaxID=205130 RepID=A0A7N9AL49_9TELE